MKKPEEIDWNNPKELISPHFTVHDCTYLPSWQVSHKPSLDEKINILKLAEKLELVREYLGRPININVWIRPISVNCENPHYDGKNYNLLIGGAPSSAHIPGMAADLSVSSMNCEEARHLLESKLEEFKLRMEKKPGSNWIHLDIKEPLKGKSRYFVP